jgi:hypothetical protein
MATGRQVKAKQMARAAEEVTGIIQRQREEISSKQARFGAADANRVFSGFMKWGRAAKQAPPYQDDSRRRDQFLAEWWNKEPIWAGILRSVAALDANQGYVLVGGRNLVNMYRRRLNKHYVAPDRRGRRQGMNAGSIAYHTADIGWTLETEREERDELEFGPLTGFYHVDSGQAYLTGDMEKPLNVGGAEWFRHDYFRISSLTSADKHGLGFCSTSIVLEMLQIMIAIYQYDQERLLARAPKGLLLLSGILEEQWVDAMQTRQTALAAREQEWFNGVAVLTSPSKDIPIEAKLMALSQLPEEFDRMKFTQLFVYTMALVVGRDPAEFWPVAGGSFGRSEETKVQHQKAIKKSREFNLDYADQLTDDVYGLPASLHYENQERDDQGMLLKAEIANAWGEFAQKMYEPGGSDGEPIFDREIIQSILVDEGIIDPRYTEMMEESQATDITKARTKGGRRHLRSLQEWAMTKPRVQRCVESPYFRDEPIIMYNWPDNREIVLWRSGDEAKRRSVWGGVTINRANEPGDIIYQHPDDESIVITTGDVTRAIAEARERTGAGFADFMTAEEMTEEQIEEVSG